MDIAKADFIEGMAKGMAVLESFDTERQRLNATLAAQRAGITRAAARRHLLTLAHLGYLESEDGYYWLSPKVLRFSGSYLASARLPRVLQPTLNRLAAQTQQSFSGVVLDDDQVVIVARSVGSGTSYPDKLQSAAPRVLAYGLHLGARLPAHATSTGRMLLACMPRNQLSDWIKNHELPRLTPHTITDSKTLRTLVTEARGQDWCVARQEHELGVFALALPLRNMRGVTVAALNVVTTPERLELSAMQRDLLPLLLDAARELRPLL
ncbi:MAG: IclR family transcriptional regulator C-terminal domain-containing protein [Pseudomonadota bacterium]